MDSESEPAVLFDDFAACLDGLNEWAVSTWDPKVLAGLRERRIWPNAHDFLAAERCGVDVQRLARARERIVHTARDLAVQAILNEAGSSVAGTLLDELPRERLSDLLQSGGLLTFEEVKVLSAAAGREVPLVVKCGLGPGRARLKFPDPWIAQAVGALEQAVRIRELALSGPAPVPPSRADLDNLGRLREVVREHGFLPGALEDYGYLNDWAAEVRTRYREGLLDPGLTSALEGLSGWKWLFAGQNQNSDLGQRRLLELSGLVAKAGTCLLSPSSGLEGGVRLGQWLADQRRNYSQGVLSEQTQSRLEALPDWTWDHAEWLDQGALRELTALSGDAENLGLSAPARARVAAWRKSDTRPSVADALELLPLWSWLPSARRDELALHARRHLLLGALELSNEQLAIARTRLLAPSRRKLVDIAQELGKSRESVRQLELLVLSMTNHPLVLRASLPFDKVLLSQARWRVTWSQYVFLRDLAIPCVVDQSFIGAVLSAASGNSYASCALDLHPTQTAGQPR